MDHSAVTRTRRHRNRGVSLIEALVALAAMAIGMLGLVGVQSTLRANSDLSKQRSEAVRLAQESIEATRAFVSFSGTAPAYTSIADGVVATGGIAGTSATFTRTTTIASLPGPVPAKTLTVTMSWQDRTNENHALTLTTVIAGIAPELVGTLTVPGEGGVTRQPQGRHRGIPLIARILPDAPGMSAMIPPGATGIAWRFDNVTGLITLCNTSAATTSALTFANLTGCTGNAVLLSGYVRYATGVPPLPAHAANPTGVPTVPPFTPWVDYTNAVGPGTERCYLQNEAYYCAVPVVAVVPAVRPSWSGQVRFDNSGNPNPMANPTLAATLASDSSSEYKTCRYQQTDASYALQADALINENFLVISAGNNPPPSGAPTAYACPTPTVAHQPT